MCPSLTEIGSKTAEKKTLHKQTDRHYENNGYLAVNQLGIQPLAARLLLQTPLRNVLIVVVIIITNDSTSNRIYIGNNNYYVVSRWL